jgi:hypothetical protein
MAEKTSRSFVAPVAITKEGLTDGAVLGSLFTSWLTKPDCAALMRNEPPSVSKTRGTVSLGIGGVGGKRILTVR